MENKIIKFLSGARTKTYASNKRAEVINGLNVYKIQDQDLEYRDSYTDQERYFQGQEIIFEARKPVWSMSYRGAAEIDVDTKIVFGFLQRILKDHSDQVRLPGITKVTDGDFRYEDSCDGDINEFSGFEKIYEKNKLVHWMKYFGGKIK